MVEDQGANMVPILHMQAITENRMACETRLRMTLTPMKGLAAKLVCITRFLKGGKKVYIIEFEINRIIMMG